MAKAKKSVFSARIVGMKNQNGWGSVQCARNGTLSWKSV